MLANERYDIILNLLERNGSVVVSDLVSKFKVSTETIRRDLFYLEKKNLLQRVHGGAISALKTREYTTLEERLDENITKKSASSEAAMKLISEGDIIFIDSGSTAVEFARVLKNTFHRLTVITHSIDVCNQLKNVRDFKLILIGGEYSADEAANHGFFAVEMIRKLHASKAFIFPLAVSLKYGLNDQTMRFIPIQREYMKNAEEIIFVADSTKFETKAYVQICEADCGGIFVTDSGLNDGIYQAYKEKGIRIYRGKEDFKD